MKNLTLLFLTFLSMTFLSFKGKPEKSSINVIPKPKHTVVYQGTFKLKESTRIVVIPYDKLKFESQYLANIIKNNTGFHSEIISGTKKEHSKNVIILRLEPKDTGNQERYQLNVNKKYIVISAPTSKGIFYGIQTLLQLLPSTFYTPVHQKDWKIPQCAIQDAPGFPYRGMHLDVSRHFFPTAARQCNRKSTENLLMCLPEQKWKQLFL